MKRFATVAALSLATAVTLALLAPGLASALAPSMTVTPSSELTSGQEIQVTASGFTPDLSIVIAQCGPVVTDISDCDVPGAKFVTTDAAGNASATLAAIVGVVGDKANPCDADHPCLVIASEPTPDPAAQRTETKVTFAGAPAAVTSPASSAAAKSGSSSSSSTGVIAGIVAAVLVAGVAVALVLRRRATPSA